MELPKLIAVENDEPSLSREQCEYTTLNDMMQNAYLYTLLQQGRAYHILYAGERVGGCMVKLVLMRVKVDGVTHEFPACEISYLVLEKNSRKKKINVFGKETTIGRFILARLIRQIRDWAKEIPIRYITIEAFNAKRLLDMYREFTFEEYQRVGKGEEYCDNVSMRIDLAERNGGIDSGTERATADYSIRFTMLPCDDGYYVKPHEIEFPTCLLKRRLSGSSDENALETLQGLLDSLRAFPIRFFMIETFPGLEHWCRSRGFQKYNGDQYPNAMYRDSVNLDAIDQCYG